jgi:hypothetical protein
VTIAGAGAVYDAAASFRTILFGFRFKHLREFQSQDR